MKIIRALIHSITGLKHAFEFELAFKIEAAAFVVLAPVALSLDVSRVEKVMLITSLLLVMIVEIINTAIERTIDRISTEQHKLSKHAKDLGSTAVFLSLIYALIVWVGVIG